MPTIGITTITGKPTYVRYYGTAIEKAGGTPYVLLPDGPLKPGEAIQSIHGLLLPGGHDITPALYHEARQPETEEPDDTRDAYELALVHLALERDIPILAICRGMQLLNVALGGKLAQHLPSHRDTEGVSAFHEVFVSPGSHLAGCLGSAILKVNSRHHQGVRVPLLSRRLTASAFSTPDGLVEGVEAPEHVFVVGVQWHPEREEGATTFQKSSARLFQAFVKAADDKRSKD